MGVTVDRLSSLLKEDAGVHGHQVGFNAHVVLVTVVQGRQVTPEHIVGENDLWKRRKNRFCRDEPELIISPDDKLS